MIQQNPQNIRQPPVNRVNLQGDSQSALLPRPEIQAAMPWGNGGVSRNGGVERNM